MSMNIRFPNITAPNVNEQVNQIKSYLHQLVEQLNWALSTLETGTVSEDSGEQPALNGITEEAFSELKALITQSSAMLDSYYEKINNRLEGQYVSQEAFSAYKQESEQSMDSKYVAQADFDSYKQVVEIKLVDIGKHCVSNVDFNAYKQESDGKYVSSEVFEAYKQENAQNITDLQRDLADLRQAIEAMQGGE